MPKMAHQRSIYRTGPHQGWLQRKTYHLSKWWRLHKAIERLRASMKWQGRSTYVLCSVALQELDDAISESRPYAYDETGDIWK